MPGESKALLAANIKLIHEVRQNMANCRIQENAEVLARYHDNILAMLKGMDKDPNGPCEGMPPLPVKMDHDMASHALAKPRQTTASGGH